MAIDAIGQVGSQSNATPRNAGIGQEDFLRILLTQLRFQDPLKPLDNQQFVAQLAQFSALENSRQSNEKFDALLQMNSTTQAIGLIGKKVEVRGVSGAGTGSVTAITFSTGEPRLTVRTTDATLVDVRLGDVSLIQQ
jgi:flagellar basal-body rod modification protein FlgD